MKSGGCIQKCTPVKSPYQECHKAFGIFFSFFLYVYMLFFKLNKLFLSNAVVSKPDGFNDLSVSKGLNS